MKRIKDKGLNRTFMELKYVTKYSVTTSKQRLNRTFMELKYESAQAQLDKAKVLIEPLWN